MIYGNISQLSDYSFLSEAVKECFVFLEKNDLKGFEKGSYEIDGERLFVNIVEYTTTTFENRFWEAHRDYLDVHVMLDGAEQIDVNFIENMEQKPFVPADDFLPMDGKKKGDFILEKGDFLICYPNDAHRTAVQINEAKAIKKAIFKVKVKDC